MRNFVWVCCVKNKIDDRPLWYFVKAVETWKLAREWIRECGPTETRRAERFFRLPKNKVIIGKIKSMGVRL